MFLIIIFGFVPTNFAEPIFKASGLSEFCLVTKTGIFKEGASSCIPLDLLSLNKIYALNK